MAKKPNAVYEPGELDRVRRNLGSMDKDEAKRIASMLGGEIGIEKVVQPPKPERRPQSRTETVTVSVGGRGGSAPRRRVEVIETEGGRSRRRNSSDSRKRSGAAADPADDPSVPIKASYRERLKMNRYLAQTEFEIKNSSQILYSMFSLFGEPPDTVNPAFVTNRMNEYYSRLEVLVTATRTMLPRNNVPRAENLRKVAPFAFKILDTIRQWNIERIASELARIQSKPREVVVEDFSELLKLFYKPIYVLGDLDPETHIRNAYRALFDQLIAENSVEAKEKHQPQFRSALSAYVYVMRSVRYLLYPLLLRLLSDKWLSYEDFFKARRRRFEAFIGAAAADKLSPAAVSSPVGSSVDAADAESESAAGRASSEADSGRTGSGLRSGSADSGQDADAIEEKAEARATAESADSSAEEKPAPARSRAWTRGIDALEGIFPEAGWRNLESWPDLYPYFAGVFDLKKGFELVAPTDPLQQIVILMHVIEELFYGMRFVAFGTISSLGGEPERVDVAMSHIVDGWHGYLEEALGKEYLPRLSEYCRLADGSPEARISNYAKRTLNEVLWIKRMNFLPLLRFDSSFSNPPFHKKETEPFFTVVRDLRRLLMGVAAGIELGNKRGGPAAGAVCDGIDNPWDPYVFQIPNPVSKRLDFLLGGKNSKRRNNAALVFFTLSAASVLDSLINEKDSYAYAEQAGCPFRCTEEGKPVFGVDVKIDADSVFKRVMRSRSAPS